MMQTLKGYIFSRPFMGERVPQHVQNIVIRDYCQRNGFKYSLSAAEYAMEGSCHILEQLVSQLDQYDGIVAYSLFQLPEEKNIRLGILGRVLDSQKTMHFAVEGIVVSTFADLENVNMLWQIKKFEHMCPKELV